MITTLLSQKKMQNNYKLANAEKTDSLVAAVQIYGCRFGKETKKILHVWLNVFSLEKRMYGNNS